MGSKLKQRCTTALTCIAIIFLVAVIVTVWVMLNQGAFKPEERQRNFTTTTTVPAQTSSRHKEVIERTHLEDFGLAGEVDFVKPLKIDPLPLHDYDIIFNQLRNHSETPTLKHNSGHFRHKEAKIWDPHPKYEIQAFGQKLILELQSNREFFASDLHVTHVWNNYSQRIRHDPRTTDCFYTGKIKDDANSDVSVSLCNGMTGYIRTSDGNYYIEPAEKFQDPSYSLLHRIKKISHAAPSFSSSENDVNDSELDQCETHERHPIVEDDFEGEVVEIKPTKNVHTITKRQIFFDDLDTEDYTLYGESDEVQRTTRDTDWAIQYDNEARKSNEYFMKVLVVADKPMVEYHQSDEDLQHYILTLMSHASLLFKGATIGNSISVSVVDIWNLKERDFNSSNSQVMLKEFCRWQETYAHKGHHDTALLLTRDTICKNSTNCNTLGVAQMGSICDPSSSCAIVKDRGLSSSYTIAHELGHVINIPHDEDRRCSVFHKGFKQNNVMSKTFQNGTKPWLWSECSKHFVTEFLDSGKAKCLRRKPTQNYITSKFSEILPGETFQVNKQCELEFGSGSRICSFMPACGNLWCTRGADEEDGCKTQYSPWAEGTACGYRRWCHYGRCIPLNRDLIIPVTGGWGPWKQWSECSRTCGGGIKQSERDCDSPVPENGGAYCTGKSIQYASCNTQACDVEVPDFRELQCSHFDGITMNLPNLTKSVVWLPKYGLEDEDDLCKLFCRPKNSNAYYILKDKVIDGTKCSLNSFGICINGICRPGGCDNKLQSKLVLDECGVCGGDNSKCEEINGSYNISSHGYHRVIRIPKGSSNLEIRQNAINDSNYLALLDGETGEYILNGKYVISNYQKDIIFGALIIKYSGSSGSIEYITTSKNRKLTRDLVVEVLSWGKKLSPPDITYRYVINRESAPKFGWILYRKQWSKCNSICSGVQYMEPICVELASNQPQAESYCSPSEKEHQIQKQDCNTHCQLTWSVVKKGPCSVNCGKGIRNLHYKCMRIDITKENYDQYTSNSLENNPVIVNENHCVILPKPPVTETCHGKCESTRWEYSEWSECSASCGGGTQRRSAKCVDEFGGTIDDAHCRGKEMISEQICNLHKCPKWSSREWTPCSVTCGRGVRTKPYYCNLDGHIYDASACNPKQMKIEKQECIERPCSIGWSTGDWTECSNACAQTRQVVCQDLDDHSTLADSFCKDILKPNSTRTCNLWQCSTGGEDEDGIENMPVPFARRNDYDDLDNSINYNIQFVWITGAWSQCSKSCETGESSRIVVCRDSFGTESDYMCNHLKRPQARIKCNPQPCPTWSQGAWSGCDSNCEKHRQVSCQNDTHRFLDDIYCDKQTKPEPTTKCKISQCTHLIKNNFPRDYFSSKENHRDQNRYRWKVGKWRRCSNLCGRGVRRRDIQCEDALNGFILVDQYCSHLRKPKTTKPCERYSCAYTWIEGYWSACSKSCGEGEKNRQVACHKVYHGGIVDPTPLPEFSKRVHPRNYCDLYTKPQNTTGCLLSRCGDLFIWNSGPWRQCSQACGRKGRQTRQLFCVNSRTGQKVQKHNCPMDLKPPRKRKCNQWRCLYKSCKEIQRHTKTKMNKDYLISIEGRPALVYCYKMDTHEPEEYISLPGDVTNFAENYHKRLKYPYTCPFENQRYENCDCLPVGPERSGLTYFWKVRLNITSLRIIGDDFTFSRQSSGSRVPYGTAGDCYSAIEGCSQARFSIDLTSTSFKLSEKVHWKNIGTAATSRLDITDRKVLGQCGGYCGNCVPDTTVGLQLEIT